jgi:glucoamylase
MARIQFLRNIASGSSTNNSSIPFIMMAAKQAIGTAYSTASRVWFTLWRGILTEVYFPTVDQPQIRDLQFLITDGETFFHEEKRDLVTTSERLPNCLGYRITNKDPEGRYTIIKEVISDPHLSCILQSTKVVADNAFLKKLKLYVLCAPHLKVGGAGNNAQVAEVAGKRLLTAWKGATWLALGATKDFERLSCGFVGASDGWTDLSDGYKMDWEFDCAFNGNVALTGEFSLADSAEFTLGVAFGFGAHGAVATLLQSLDTPFEEQKKRFTDQWARARNDSEPLAKASLDGGHLALASYKILLAHEDKLNPGGLIASLSIPWGESKGDEDLGGYHLVWPRDMVNSATGLLAAGNQSTPLRALVFLAASQKSDGGFPQNFWINGDPYWSGTQLDEVAFPIMLAWRLYSQDGLKHFDPFTMVMNAATFLVLNGPITQQERWEENGGYSPSTLAANISALISAATFARRRNQEETACFFEDYADYMKCHLFDWTVTTDGAIHPDIKEHFVRINPVQKAFDANDLNHATIHIANRLPGEQSDFPAKDVIDGGFLELVRYGILPPDHPTIIESVKVMDYSLKVDTPNGPSWHRYNYDGYGQGPNAEPFVSYGIGRAWPLLTGERGHYELACGHNVDPYIKAMEMFASPCGPIPEQVWDGPDLPDKYMFLGKPTGSAMPLAWAHAEYLKLLRSKAEGKVFDLIPEVKTRYVDNPSVCKLFETWRHNWQINKVRRGFILRILSEQPFKLRWTNGDWEAAKDQLSTDLSAGVSFVDIQILFDQTFPLSFTFYWTRTQQWEGTNYSVEVI